jgi:hypothetical protein
MNLVSVVPLIAVVVLLGIAVFFVVFLPLYVAARNRQL